MKKLIVLGIIATMVMGLAAAASAQIDQNWVFQMKAFNGASTPNATAGVTLGVKPGANNAYVEPEDGQYPAYTGTPGTVVDLINDVTYRTNKDYRAPLVDNETKVWDLVVFVVNDPSPQTMRLDMWMATASGNTLQEGGNQRVWLQFANGDLIWEAPYDLGGKAAEPQFRYNLAYNGAPIYLQLVASTVPPVEVPEPGSMLAMFSGLVGLVGFGIRRRK